MECPFHFSAAQMRPLSQECTADCLRAGVWGGTCQYLHWARWWDAMWRCQASLSCTRLRRPRGETWRNCIFKLPLSLKVLLCSIVIETFAHATAFSAGKFLLSAQNSKMRWQNISSQPFLLWSFAGGFRGQGLRCEPSNGCRTMKNKAENNLKPCREEFFW